MNDSSTLHGVAGSYPYQSQKLSCDEKSYKKKVLKNKTGKALVLVDFENVIGSYDSPFMAAEKFEIFMKHILPADKKNDIIIGVGYDSAASLFALPSPIKVVIGEGKDAGELALINSINYVNLVDNYDRLVIVSGDRKFTPVLTLSKALKVQTVVIAHRDNSFKSLREESDWFIHVKSNKELNTDRFIARKKAKADSPKRKARLDRLAEDKLIELNARINHSYP